MTIKVGDVVAYCCRGNLESRRIRNVSVTRVMKTFIETQDGSRFSPRSFRNILVGMENYYIDPQVSYWDSRDARNLALQELNTGFEKLISAARNRNWEQVKTCFNNLSNLIGE